MYKTTYKTHVCDHNKWPHVDKFTIDSMGDRMAKKKAPALQGAEGPGVALRQRCWWEYEWWE
jgi:hypothetical protein